MNRIDKKQILNMLSRSLEIYHPHLKNHFKCPTCLKNIPLTEKNRISEAHIIPQAAGGKLKTYACCDCNSRFGSKQDKWFGDFVNIANSPLYSPVSTGIKKGYYTIDGLKINGHWEKDENNNLVFYYLINRNSPDMNKLMEEKFKKHPSQIQVSVPLPILENERLIDIGVLTAGYLMWFGMCGYAWALQSHLDIVREQMHNPNDEIITARYVFHCKQKFNWQPWVGIAPIDDSVVPVFGMKEHLVVFPPRDNPGFYTSLKTGKRNINLSEIKPISLSQDLSYSAPIAIMYENNIIIAPDMFETYQNARIIRFTGDSNHAEVLVPIEKEPHEIENEENVEVIQIKL